MSSSSSSLRRIAADAASSPIIWTSTAGQGRRNDTLLQRIMGLIFDKRSAIEVLHQWSQEKRQALQKYQLNRIVRHLRQHKRFVHALQICEWMRIQQHIQLLPGDYAVHLDLIAKVRGLASAEKFFEDLPVKMKVQPTATALLHNFVQNKMSSRAESLMEEMATYGLLRCPLPFNHMVRLYVSTDEIHKIPKLIEEMKRYTSPDLFTYNLWLNAFMKNGDIVRAEKVYLKMQKENIVVDWVAHSMLAHIYIKASCCEKAKDALVEMEKRISRNERHAYCSLLSLHANISDVENVRRIWNTMKSTFRKLSDAEYRCMLSSLTKLGEINEAENVYNEWKSISTTTDARPPNIILSFYVKNDMMEKALQFHNRMIRNNVKLNYTTWELLAFGFLKMNQMAEVLKCLNKAFSSLEKWDPNVELVKKVFCEIEKNGDVESADKFLAILRVAGYVTTEIYNSLIRVYIKAGKNPLVVAERMRKDQVEMNEETKHFLGLTSKLCAEK